MTNRFRIATGSFAALLFVLFCVDARADTDVTAVPAGTNVLVDSGFEAGLSGFTGYPAFPYQRSREQAHGGAYSVPFPQGLLKKDDTGSRDAASWLEKPIMNAQTGVFRVNGGETWVFSLFVKSGQTPQQKPLEVQIYESSCLYSYTRPTVKQLIAADGQWHEVKLTIPVPEGSPVLTIGFSLSAKGWVDDLALMKVASAAKPLTLTTDAPVYHKPGSALRVKQTLRNAGGTEAKVALRMKAFRPSGAIAEALPLAKGYETLWRELSGQEAVLSAGQALEVEQVLDTAALPEGGVLLVSEIVDASGKVVDCNRREVLICQRPDYRRWFSIGAQYYQSDRFTGEWVKQFKDFGGDAVREQIPMPWCYRENVAGQTTDYPDNLRLGYYMRQGLKWYASVIFQNGKAPCWLAEKPGNRINFYEGRAMESPVVNWHAPEVLAAARRNAEAIGKRVSACPGIFSVQVDNELGVSDDYSPAAQESFRQYLLARYGSLETLNKTLGTDFKTAQEIVQPAPVYTYMITHGASAMDLAQPVRRNPALDFVWFGWRQKAFTDFYRLVAGGIKKEAPDVAVLNNFMLYVDTHPRAFYNAPLNLADFSEFFDVGGVDAIPSISNKTTVGYQMSWLNSAWRDRGIWVPESSQPWATLHEREVGFNLFFYAGRKTMHFCIFNWPVIRDKAEDLHSSAVTRENKGIFATIRSAFDEAKRFDKQHGFADMHYVAPQAAVYWSEDILNLPLAVGTQSWLGGGDSTVELYRVLDDTQYEVKLVEEKQFNAGIDDGGRALFVGGAFVLSRATYDKMLAFARGGGTLFFNGGTGVYDKDLRPYAHSPCAAGEALDLKVNGWEGGSRAVYSEGAGPLVKLGRNRLVRGFGGYKEIALGAEWQVLLRDAENRPALATRTFGKGRVFWAFTDLANPYASFRSPNTAYLMEGILEASGAGRLAGVKLGGDPASDVVASHKHKQNGEDFLFLNNFGKAGDFTVLLNVPTEGLQVTDAVSGAAFTLKTEGGLPALTLPLGKLDYRVLRIQTPGADLTRPGAHAFWGAPGDLAKRKEISRRQPAPDKCSLLTTVARDGSELITLSGPFAKLIVTPAHGGRIVGLYRAGESVNQTIPFPNLLEDSVSGSTGGMKAILSPTGEENPGIAADKSFAVVAKRDTPVESGVTLAYQDAAGGHALTETIRVSREDPAIRWTVEQTLGTNASRARLYFHSNLLLGGEVKRGVLFAGGGDGFCKTVPYEFAKRKGVAFTQPVQWGAVIEPESRTALLAVAVKEYKHLRFWNDMNTYNLEFGSDDASPAGGSRIQGELALYLLSGFGNLNFVHGSMAGAFRSWSDNAAQYLKVEACLLGGRKQEAEFVVKGVKAQGEERELGKLLLTLYPAEAASKSVSTGGAGSGFMQYNLYLRADGKDVLLYSQDGDGTTGGK